MIYARLYGVASWCVAFAICPAVHAGPVKLKVKPKTTSGRRPARRVALPYAEAKKLLAQGQPAAALRSLSTSRSSLLADREALVRGDALKALGNLEGARKAYEAALAQARVEGAAVAAARGLVDVHGQLGQREKQLVYIDALLSVRRVRRRAGLMLERATVLRRMGKKNDAARVAWQILQDYPTARIAEQAQKMLDGLVKRGAKRPSANARTELSRIRNLWRSRAFGGAEKALDRLEKRSPKMARAIKLERIEMYAKQRRTDDEMALLNELLENATDQRVGPTVLERLGRLAMRRDDDEGAVAYFDRMAKLYPNHKKTVEAQFLASWLSYNSADYAQGARRMLAFTKRYRKWHRRPEALWFAGWSAYLGGQDGLSRRAFSQLLEDHPTSDMNLWAYYWTGRIHERNKFKDEARRSYRQILRRAPMSYWGHWASAGLARLGEEVVLDPPPTTKPATIEQGLEVIGKQRPVNVDRGIALSEVGLKDEAVDELRAASAALAKIRNTAGRIIVAEMVGQLGSHHQAFRLAAAAVSKGGDLVSGRPYAWRAWRLAYPKAFEEHVAEAAKAHDVDPLLVLSLMRTESAFRPWVRSRVGARGLMQLMPKTARSIGREAKGGRAHAARYTNPRSNIWLGAWYIKKLLERYHGHVALAAGAYNAGPGAMDRWLKRFSGRHLDEFIESLSYRETRRYVRRVLETYQTYRRLDGQPRLKLMLKVESEAPPDGSVSF